MSKMPEWFSAVHLPPEESGEYLVLFRWVGYKDGRFKKEIVSYDAEVKKWDMDGIVWWMPLPASPEVDND
jgi:hypothetical protein